MLDAVSFIKNWDRMTNGCADSFCKNCPFHIGRFEAGLDDCTVYIFDHPEESVKIVERWLKDNPPTTYKDDLLEKYPNALMYSTGSPMLCLKIVYGEDAAPSDCGDIPCNDCWGREYEKRDQSK